MGNLPSCTMPNLSEFTDSKPNSRDIDVNDYQVVQEVHDLRFGVLRLMKNKSNNHTLYLKERDLSFSLIQLDEIKFRSQLENPNLLEIYGFRREIKERRIQIYFETFDGDLEKDITQAISEKTPLSEEKLNIVLHSSLNALSYLQENNVAHENITPTNILRLGDNYKLYESLIIGSSKTLYQNAQKGPDIRYLAPELLAQLAKNMLDGSGEYAFKADIYSLGVCLLDAGALDYGDLTLVNRKKFEVNQENLQTRIKRFKELYSPQLSTVVEEMLNPDPSKRPDAITLYNRLPSGARSNKRRVFSPRSESPGRSSPRQDLNVSGFDIRKPYPAEAVVQRTFAKRSEETKTGNEGGLSLENTALPVTLGMQTTGYLEDNRRKKIDDQHPVFTFAGTRSSFQVKDESQIDYGGLKDMNISENIVNDPVLSRYVKKMYEQEVMSKAPVLRQSYKKSSAPESFFKTDSPPQRKVPLLTAKIEDILQRITTRNSSLRSSPGSDKLTTRRIIASIPETKLKGPQDFRLSSLDNSYIKTVTRPPSYKPNHHLNGILSGREYQSPSNNSTGDNKYNFIPSSDVSRSPLSKFEHKFDLSGINKSIHENKTPIVSDLDADLEAKFQTALLKSQANLERMKSSGVYNAFEPHSVQKDSLSLRSSHHNLRSSRSFQEKPAEYESNKKLSSALKIQDLSITPLQHDSTSTAKENHEYNKLSSAELASLVAEIKKEFQPKLKEVEINQYKAEVPFAASVNTPMSKHFESTMSSAYKESVPVGKIERKFDFGENSATKVSNMRGLDLRINELKKELHSLFKQEESAGNK